MLQSKAERKILKASQLQPAGSIGETSNEASQLQPQEFMASRGRNGLQDDDKDESEDDEYGPEQLAHIQKLALLSGRLKNKELSKLRIVIARNIDDLVPSLKIITSRCFSPIILAIFSTARPHGSLNADSFSKVSHVSKIS